MAFEHLNQKEAALLKAWQEEGRKKPSLSTSLSVQLFELFLHGIPCEEIISLNRGIMLEQVLEARVRDGWDERRNAYLDDLYGNVVGRVSQVQAEGVTFLTNMLAAAHKLHGSKLTTYLQTGDEKDLGEFKISGWQNYKGVVDTLMKLTGQDREKSPGAPARGPTVEQTSQMTVVRTLPPGGVKVLDAAADANLLMDVLKNG